MLLANCWPWGYDDDYEYEPYWCTYGNHAASQLATPEKTQDEVLKVLEGEIAIVADSARTDIRLPVVASEAVDLVDVTATLRRLDTDMQVDWSTRRTRLEQGRNDILINMAGLREELWPQVYLSYTLQRAVADGQAAPEALHGSASVAENVEAFRVHTAVPDSLLAGSNASLRVVGTLGGKPVAGFDVDVSLESAGQTVASVSTSASDLGVATATLAVPKDLTGSAQVSISATAEVGGAFSTKVPVRITRGGALMLSTDKPRYQPGQTMHLRLMALERPEMKPIADEEILVEIADGKDYKVFKKSLVTNHFGIAHTTFKLASEVNTGTYQLTATMGDEEVVEPIIVERYVLPKFSIAVDLDRSYVISQQPLVGTVDVRYTFGEPAANSIVSLKLEYGDETLIASTTGSTDDKGRYRFEMAVPQLAETDSVRLSVEAVDPAGQESSKELALPTSEQGVELWMVPAEDRVAGEPWTLYVIARDPAGQPVQGTGTARLGTAELPLATNAIGIAELSLAPGLSGDSLLVSLAAPDGLSGSAAFAVSQKDFPAGLALETNRPRYAAGEEAELTIKAPQGVTMAAIEVLRDGAVVDAKVAALGADGSGTAILQIDHDMDGVMLVEAFAIDATGTPLRGRTAMYVLSASKLRIETTLDKEVYRPAETAQLDIHVTDRSGEGVASALGVVVVDEAVYALQSFNPTTYQQFFSGQTLPSQVDHVMDREGAQSLMEDEEAPSEQDLAARAVLAATAHEQATPDPMVDHLAEMERYYGTFAVNRALGAIATELSRGSTCDGKSFDDSLAAANELAQATADPWGRPYTVEATQTNQWQATVSLTSGGPDEQMGTDDDISTEMNVNL